MVFAWTGTQDTVGLSDEGKFTVNSCDNHNRTTMGTKTNSFCTNDSSTLGVSENTGLILMDLEIVELLLIVTDCIGI